jgi:hypothetical protein
MESAMNKKERSALKMNINQNMTTHQPQRVLGVFAHPDDESFCEVAPLPAQSPTAQR